MAITKIVVGDESSPKTVVDFGNVTTTAGEVLKFDGMNANKFFNSSGILSDGAYIPPKLVGAVRSTVDFDASLPVNTFDDYIIGSKDDFNKSVVISPNSTSNLDGIEGATVNVRLNTGLIHITTTTVNMTSNSYLHSIPKGWHEGSKINITVDTYNGDFE